MRYNTIIHNTGNGIQLGGQAAASVNIVNNNLFGNGTYDLYLTGGQAGTQNFTVNATNNFWNIDSSQIPNRIRDCTFDDNGCGTASSTVGKVVLQPAAGRPDQTAPAFVRSVTINPNPVGLQRGTVTVDFSKPMSMTALPAASFHDAWRGTTQQVFSDTANVMAKDVLGRMWFGRQRHDVWCQRCPHVRRSPVDILYDRQLRIGQQYHHGYLWGCQWGCLVWPRRGMPTEAMLSRLQGIDVGDVHGIDPGQDGSMGASPPSARTVRAPCGLAR